MNHVDNPFKSPAILSYCTGFRGIERGLERAIGTVRTAVYVEIEAFVVENLLAGMEAGLLVPAPIWPNIKTFDARPFRGKIHGIIGGYPCQPFSNAGERRGTDDPRHLYPYLERDIKAVNPVWCFFENVAGHLSLGYEQVSASIRAMGYAVEAGIYSAEEVGAPHQRDRLFILAIRKDYVAYCNRYGLCRNNTGGFQPEAQRSGKELANCESEGERRLSECKQGQERQKQGNGFNAYGGSEELADTGLQRQEIRQKRTAGIEQCCKELEHPNIGDEQPISRRPDEIQPEIPNNSNASKELAYPIGARQQEQRNYGQQAKESDIGTVSTGADSEKNAAGVDLVNPCGQRQQRSEQHRTPAERERQQEPYRSTQQSSGDRWPARPGEQQYYWEEPRTEGYTDRLPGSIRKLWHLCRKDFEKVMGEEVWTETERNIKANVVSPVGIEIDGYNFREDLLRAYGNSVVEQTAEIAFLDLLNKHGLL